ncbi:MAG: alcohol dehydrogenase catalytic domain-containing protein [Verrucomicrobiota bacterium]
MLIPKTMRALVYRGINHLRIETVPVPSIRSNELLVKVAVCGVCPTDIKKIQYGTVTPPRIFGHETAGTIVRLGARVKNFRVGDRVGLHHHVPCLQCHVCRHGTFAQCETYQRTGITAGFEPAGGGYAEYVRVMPFVFPGIVKIPSRNSFIEGAMLEPVNTVLKAIKRLNLLRGDDVLVAGQGPIGLIFTRLLALRGINVIASDLLQPRLNLARRFGAALALNAAQARFDQRIQKSTQKKLLDAAIIAVPSDETVLRAERLVRGGGQILLFAHTRRGSSLGIDPSTICVDEKDFIGSYSSDVTLQPEVARLIFSRKLDVRLLVTHEFSLHDAAKAIQLAAQPTPNSLKIVVGAAASVLSPRREAIPRGIGH